MTSLVTIRRELLELDFAQMRALAPLVAVCAAALAAALIGVLKSRFKGPAAALVVVLGAVVGVAFLASHMGKSPVELFGARARMDAFSAYSGILFLLFAVLSAMSGYRYFERRGIHEPEYYSMMLFSCCGMLAAVMSCDLVNLFISMELMSLPVYALVAVRRGDRRGGEAAIKYFVLGGVGSAMLLFGAAQLYGASGSLTYDGIRQLFVSTAMPGGTALVGAGLVLSGFFFKAASFPFHMWLPDAYEGAPAPITGFMAAGVKAAAVLAMIRFVSDSGIAKPAPAQLAGALRTVFLFAAVATMIYGNLVALAQNNLKRMLAYSAIAHTGYIITGLVPGTSAAGRGVDAVVFYLLAYGLSVIGAFAALSRIAGKEDGRLNLHDVSGLASRSPGVALALTVFVLSLAGIPATAGFAAKFWLFYSVVEARETALVIVGVLCSAISVYYYLRVVVYMYMREPVGASPGEDGVGRFWPGVAAAVLVASVGMIGILPSQPVELARKAVAALNRTGSADAGQ